MAEFDMIIRGGTIVDGTLAPRYVSDLAIKDGKVARIGGLRGSGASRVLDASGLIVCPGFVDLHTHYDSQIQWDPYCTLSGWHGVTSVAIGNCGFGFAPCRVEDQERMMLTMTRNEAVPFDAMKEGMLWDWVTFPQWLDTLDRIPKGVNVLTYVPLTPLYAWVMGMEAAKSRRPTEGELSEMCRLINEGMDAGACGWSAQVLGPYSNQRDYDGTPMITDLMTEEELLTFARVLAERDEGCIQLAYRTTDPTGLRLLEPIFQVHEKVAQAAGRPILYQEVPALANNPEQHRQVISWLEDCTRKGLRIYGQGETHKGGFEFTFHDWNLFDSSPNWREVTAGTREERLAKMQDPERRRLLRAEWDEGTKPGGGAVDGSLEGLVIQGVGQQRLEHYIGEKIGIIAANEGKHVVDALLDVVVEDGLETEFFAILSLNNPEYTAELLHSPHVIAGTSDGGAHVKFATLGRYPTELLIWLVRDEGVVSLEEAHYKLSYLAAFGGGFRDRGFLREGAPADIVVYDLEGLKLLPTEVAYDFPAGEWRRVQRAEGYRWTIVNGQLTFEDGEPTGALPGQLLRHGVA